MSSERFVRMRVEFIFPVKDDEASKYSPMEIAYNHFYNDPGEFVETEGVFEIKQAEFVSKVDFDSPMTEPPGIVGLREGAKSYVSEWISCSERMPDLDITEDRSWSYHSLGKEVLICVYGNSVKAANLYYSQDAKRYWWENGEGQVYDLEQVSHWMPMPEPPKK